MVEKNYNVIGMSCAACANIIEKKLNKEDGIEASVNIATEKLNIKYDENSYNFEKIKEIVQKSGYDLIEKLDDDDKVKIYEDKIKELKNKLTISVIFVIPLLYVSMGHMLGMPLPKIINPHYNPLNFAIFQAGLTLPIIYSGRDFFIHGIKNLIRKAPTMDTLIAIGTSASIIYGIYGTYMIYKGNNEYAMELYYESAAVIISLILLGKLLEMKTKGSTSSAIKKLIGLQPKKARVLIGEKEIEIELERVKLGDLIVVKPGEKIPVDGEIIEGTTSIDELMITGESIPITKNKGNNVIGGSINKNGHIVFKATKIGENTMLSQIIKLVEEAQGSKVPISRMADIVSGYFVIGVIIISLITGISWYILDNNITNALTFFISVLVIACPCALGLATPTSIMVGTGKAAENGILIKSGEALETTHRLTTIILDKTGTITNGKPEVTDLEIFGNYNERNILEVLASIEKKSEHVLAETIVKYAEKKDTLLKECDKFRAFPGYGIRGIIDDKEVQVGNEKLMIKRKIEINDKQKNIYEKLSSEGKTSMYISVGGEIVGIIAVADTIKKGSKLAIEKLKKIGLKVVMLTGDNDKTAKYIANQVGIERVISEVLPYEKANVVKEIQGEKEFVAMVGDGINDSPALAQANIGIAVGNGTDIAIESADIILIKNNIEDVLSAIKLSSATMKNIKENLFWAFFYNTIGIPFASGLIYALFNGIKLNPMIAAFAMTFSSISVLLNALRLKRIKLK